MKAPEKLKPNSFIKVLRIINRHGDTGMTICWVKDCWEQLDERWWKSGYWASKKTGSGVAVHLNKWKTPLDWSEVLAWDYVDDSDLIEKIKK